MFSELVSKWIDGHNLTDTEKTEMKNGFRNVDSIESLVSSWLIPGTSVPFIPELRAGFIFVPSGEIRLGDGSVGSGFSGVRIGYPAFSYNNQLWNIAGVNNDVLQVGIRATDGFLVAGGGNVEISNSGIAIIEGNAGQSFLDFYDITRTKNVSIKFSGSSMQIQNTNIGGALVFFVRMTDSSNPYITLQEDDIQTNRTLFQIQDGAMGSRLEMGLLGKIDLRTEGTGGGSTFARVVETTATPPDPGNKDAFHLYIKNDKFIIQFNDGGTVRYKYLDLTGTGVTWVHTTVAP